MLAADDEMLKRDVVAMRLDFLERQFGPLPDRMRQLVNLQHVWPGGGIYEMSAPHLGGLGVLATHGLTNPDMPARLRPLRDNPALTEPRVPRPMPPGLAGYGYELVMLTPKPDPWPLLSMSWFVQMEILNDLGLLEHVADGNGVVVEGVKIGDGTETGPFLVHTACAPVLGRLSLPNGLMHILIATWVTQDEMEYARDTDDGRFTLLNMLVDAGHGPVSRRDRRSVLPQ